MALSTSSQNFSPNGNQIYSGNSPTITSDQPMGWQAASQNLSGAINSIGGYLVKQQESVQKLQLQQADDLSKARTMASLYYPSVLPHVDAMIAQNPYARKAFPQGNYGNAGQGSMGGSPNMFGSIIGAPGTTPYGTGMLPESSGGNSGGTSMNPMNPVNGPVATSGTITSGGLEPPKISQTIQNPAGEAQVQAAKTGAEGTTTAQVEANVGVSKDAQQLAMITNALKPLAQSYDKVYNSKVAGILPAGGDNYGSTIVKEADKIPRLGGIQNAIVPPDVQQSSGKFLANKNELVTKLQPLLSQQFGKDGSSRIMESLLNMSQNEIGDLNTPRDQFHGQLTGTISSLYRIAKAAQAYRQDLQTSGQQPPDPQTAAQEITKRMSLQNMGPAEQKELQGLIDNTLGNKIGGATGSFGGSQNPVTSAPAKQSQATQKQGTQLDRQTATQILQAAGGDANKARQMARNMGYSF